MTFGADGRKIRHSFHRVMMRSAAKLSYPQAQAAIDGRPDDTTGPILEPVLQPLWAAYEVLKRGRNAREPLELDLPERKILLKPDGTVDRVVVPERLDAHKLIEEFMIQANVAAAETLEAKRQRLVYRIHDGPSLAKQELLREFLQTIGLSLARGAQLRPSQFNQILEARRGRRQRAAGQRGGAALAEPGRIFARQYRPFRPQPAPLRALHLADPPLRRPHRPPRADIGPRPRQGRPHPAEEERLEDVAALISAAERRAMAAERDTVDRLVALYLSERTGDTFDGRISGVVKAGLFVQLPKFGADGFIPVSSLDGDYYIYDETARSLYGERTGKGFQLADSVEVRLVEVQPLAGSMRFEMLTPPKPCRRQALVSQGEAGALGQYEARPARQKRR